MCLPGTLNEQVRVEIVWARLNKTGVAHCGMLKPSASSGDSLVIFKSFVPGDNPEDEESEPYPMRRGCGPRAWLPDCPRSWISVRQNSQHAARNALCAPAPYSHACQWNGCRRYVKCKGRSSERIQRRYLTENDPMERAELNAILEVHTRTIPKRDAP